MFLSLLQFLFVARSEAVIVNEYEWNSLLEDLLEKVKAIVLLLLLLLSA